MPFPLLRLPRLTIENILSFLEPIETIEFSLLSNRSLNLVHLLNQRRTDLSLHVLLIGERRKLIVFKDVTILFELSVHTDKDVVHWDHCINRKVDGRQLRLGVHNCRWLFLNSESCENDLIFWVHYIMEVLKLSVKYLGVLPNRHINFDKVFVETDIFHKADQITIHHCTLSHQEMTYLLDHLITDKLWLAVKPERSFRYEKPICFALFYTHFPFWITQEKLLETARTSMTTYLDQCELILDALIKQWIDSDDKETRCVELRHYDFPGQLPVLENVLNGIDWVPGGSMPKLEKYSVSAGKVINYNRGVAIHRKDGRLASLLLNATTRSMLEFRFVVWDNVQ